MSLSRFFSFHQRMRPGRWVLSLSMVAAGCGPVAVTASAPLPPLPPPSEPMLMAAPAAVRAPASRKGAVYRPAPAVVPELAQVVFFRSATASPSTGPAHVYVDGEFHAALMPNGFTRLCVAPGAHSLEAYIDDAPLYAGKSQPKTQAVLEGGRTVFVAVSEMGEGAPVPHGKREAERMLKGAREQRHVISRAVRVQPCREPSEQARRA
ncbi:hypothetical protein GFK26_27755 [Variovorax paradoxus]|uniref:DUF2846 domain-containing protein n=1 Tax=Variovorax paradoxus TaxID=34073 RepID=A0A5Q0MCS5_VARPD|nr:hypothetical protein [Variovorax paradoxus]QFZ86285.1 hypothetical protein GFK26_27755 [Variovorax paradoxus]